MKKSSYIWIALGSFILGAVYTTHTNFFLSGAGTPAALAQEQSLMPTPVPTVSWLLDNTQSFAERPARLRAADLRCDSSGAVHGRADENEIIQELSRFALSFDDKRRPILHYRFSRGKGRTPSAAEAP